MNDTRLTPLGRLTVLVAILTLGAIAGAAGAAATRPHAHAWRCVTVRPGETLWGMAGSFSDGDRREAMHRVAEHNRLEGPPYAGMSLWVPTDGGEDLLDAAPESCPAAG